MGKRLTTEGAECTETESRGDGLPEYWKESGEGLLASCADKGVPACFSSLSQKQDQYTGKWNKVKRIIVPSGYSNELQGA